MREGAGLTDIDPYTQRNLWNYDTDRLLRFQRVTWTMSFHVLNSVIFNFARQPHFLLATGSCFIYFFFSSLSNLFEQLRVTRKGSSDPNNDFFVRELEQQLLLEMQ